jgi:F0F1-type ATP synthase membrane subunit c/vacuolar-type H+-ATPase subunit K
MNQQLRVAKVLYTLGKMIIFEMPTHPTHIDLLALVAPTILVVNLIIFRKRLGSAKTNQDFLSSHIVYWALNESIAIFGFIASFMSLEGNGFFYVVNAAIAIIANLRSFPNWKAES